MPFLQQWAQSVVTKRQLKILALRRLWLAHLKSSPLFSPTSFDAITRALEKL
jgi:hypothetical protein